MKIILATSNAHKFAEVKKILKNFELYPLEESRLIPLLH